MAVRDLAESERNALLVAAQICATFSLMGSLFILVCYTRYAHLRKLSFTLVFWLAVSDVGSDITYFMGNPEAHKAACVAQGCLQQFFQMAQILWTVAIACVLHDVTVNLRMYHPHEQKSLMSRFHMYVWGAALVSMILPFTTDSYGTTGSWCWIRTNPDADVDLGTMWRYLVLYIPLWAAIVFNIAVYFRVAAIVKRFSIGIAGGGSGEAAVGPSAEQQTRMTKFVKRLVWYPAVLIASWAFATINRIQNAANPDHPVFGLFLLHTSLVAFQGFFNALVYGSTDTIRDAVAQEPFVERYCKSRAGGGSGLGIGSGGIGGGRDPEDDGDAAGVRLENLSYNEMTDDSLGGFGDVEENTSSNMKKGPGGGGTARVIGSGVPTPSDTNDDDVEVYNAANYTVSV